MLAVPQADNGFILKFLDSVFYHLLYAQFALSKADVNTAQSTTYVAASVWWVLHSGPKMKRGEM